MFSSLRATTIQIVATLTLTTAFGAALFAAADFATRGVVVVS